MVAAQQVVIANPVNVHDSPRLPATWVAVEKARAANPTMNNRMIAAVDIIELSTARLRHTPEGPRMLA